MKKNSRKTATKTVKTKRKNNFTAVFTSDPHSELTKTKFSTVKRAEEYIRAQGYMYGKDYNRGNWLVIDTEHLPTVLTELEQKMLC